MPLHKVDVHVGSRLRALRIAKGLSQSNVAEHVGITFQQIQKYERGANRIGASRLYEFGQMLGVNIASFFAGLDLPDYQDEILSSPALRAARFLDGLNVEDRTAFLALIKKFHEAQSSE